MNHRRKGGIRATKRDISWFREILLSRVNWIMKDRSGSREPRDSIEHDRPRFETTSTCSRRRNSEGIHGNECPSFVPSSNFRCFSSSSDEGSTVRNRARQCHESRDFSARFDEPRQTGRRTRASGTKRERDSVKGVRK